METVINPGEFTEKELLKLVYRDLHTLRTDFDEYKKDNTVHTQIQELQLNIIKLQNNVSTEILQVQNNVNQQEKLRVEQKKQLRFHIYVVTVILAALSFLLKFYVKN